MQKREFSFLFANKTFRSDRCFLDDTTFKYLMNINLGFCKFHNKFVKYLINLINVFSQNVIFNSIN